MGFDEGSASRNLIVWLTPGPPGPPDKVAVEEITDSTAQLSWTPGRDNGSPITGYIIQARTPFTVGWQAVDSGTMGTLSPLSPFCSIWDHLWFIFIFSAFNLTPVVRTTWFSKERVGFFLTSQCRRWSTGTRWRRRWWVWTPGWSTSSGWWPATSWAWESPVRPQPRPGQRMPVRDTKTLQWTKAQICSDFKVI